jgi:hypothetical protein
MPSANHVYSDDPYLGRILAELVSPPHIAISLKHCILSVENIDNRTAASLFIAASSQTPMDDGGRVSILAYPGPGCTPNEPMALVVKLSDSVRTLDEKKPEAILLPSQEGPTPFDTRYSTHYKELLEILCLIDCLLQYTTAFINPKARCYQSNPPILINPPLAASALTPSHPLIQLAP